jgi:hypothetical protein
MTGHTRRITRQGHLAPFEHDGISFGHVPDHSASTKARRGLSGMMRAMPLSPVGLAAVLLAVGLAGCGSPYGVQAPPPPVQGPTDLGQELHVDVANTGPDDLRLRIALAGQDEVRYRMTAGQRHGEAVVPHVGRAYDGSIPPGSEVVVREGDHEARLVVEDRGGPVWLLIEPSSDDGHLALMRFDEQPVYD